MTASEIFGTEAVLQYVDLSLAVREAQAPSERMRFLLKIAELDSAARRFPEALRRVDEARACAGTFEEKREVEFTRGKILRRCGRNAEAADSFQAVINKAGPPDGFTHRAGLQLAKTYLGQGRFTDAMGLLEKCLQSGELSPERRRGAQYDLAFALIHQGLFQAAAEAIDRASDPLRGVDRLARGKAAYYRGWLAFAQSRIPDATALFDDARREFSRHRDPDALACADLSRACIDYSRADLPACLERCEVSLRAGDLRSDVGASIALLSGLALFVMGRNADALAAFGQAERLAEGRADVTSRALEWAAEARSVDGDHAEATQLLERCLAVRRDTGDRLGECMALWVLGRIRQRQGDYDAATKCFEQQRHLAVATGNAIERIRADAGEAEVALARGDVASAWSHAHAAAKGCEGKYSRRHAIELVLLARIVTLQNDFDQAEQLYARALDLLKDDPNHVLRGEALASRAEERADRGDVDRALSDLHAARELAVATGSARLIQAIRAQEAEIRDRRAAQVVLERFVEPRVASRLVARADRRLAENLQQTATILFCDIRDYTTLTEKLNVHEIVEMLNEHFEAMAETIRKHDGWIDKYIGDAIMAVFGAPGHPAEDDALRCVTAALDMVARRKRLNEARLARGLKPVEIGVGIDTGPVIMGTIGYSRQLSYTVIGDTVNVASRLEGLTKSFPGKRILVSGETARAVGKAALLEPLGSHPVKGKEKGIELFAPFGP